MGLNEKIQFANRKAVGAGGKRELVVKPPSKKTSEAHGKLKCEKVYRIL